jgi:uncharacterized protein YbjT (DUF2867 family)
VITIVGGTGRLGRLVTARLVAQGCQVRVVARSAPATPVPNAHLALADVRKPATLPAAVAGSEVVVSAMHGIDPNAGQTPASVDRDGNLALIAAARAAGADIVLVSIIGAALQHPIELFRMKAAAEAALIAGAPHGATGRGPDWTVVRAAAFAEMWVDIFRQTAGKSGVPKVMGRGRNAVNFVSVDDVAVAVARAATQKPLRGHVIEVAGEDLTPTALAALVAAPGTRPSHIPVPVVWAIGNLLRPVKPGLARVARQTLVMERVPLATDPAVGHEKYPWLPLTPIAECVGRRRT